MLMHYDRWSWIVEARGSLHHKRVGGSMGGLKIHH
jgi:hypothetical protein